MIYNKYFGIIFLALMSFCLADEQMTVEAMSSYEAQYEAIMNNVVNSRTPGYKATVTGVESKDGKIVTNVDTSMKQGVRTHSGNPYHVAIDSQGFFLLSTPEGNLLTRDGRFTINSQYELVTLSGGFPVQGEDGNLELVPDESGSITFTITETGLIIQGGDIEAGRILIVNCDELESLNGVFFRPHGDIIPVEKPRLIQYFQEASNVEITKELIMMPQTTKKYDANAKTLQILKSARKTGLEMGRSQ